MPRGLKGENRVAPPKKKDFISPKERYKPRRSMGRTTFVKEGPSTLLGKVAGQLT